jgi:hypothetical protein
VLDDGGGDFGIEQAMASLVDLMATSPYLASVGIGVPEVVAPQLSGWVTLGGPKGIDDRLGETRELSIDLHCWLGVVVMGDTKRAELLLAQAVPDLMTRLTWNSLREVGSVGRNLNGTCVRIGEPGAVADSQLYILIAGQEVRVYPLSITVTLHR